MLDNKNFTKLVKKAYEKSLVAEKLQELKDEYQILDTLLFEVEGIINSLFLNSLGEQKNLNIPSLHMAFSGSFGTGKSSFALKIAQILRDLNYLTKGHLTSVTREDLVGQYIGHTAPKTKEILQQSQGGVLFIDQASQLYKANNEKDYGAEAIEIILQVMENQRNDLALIFSDTKSQLDHFFHLNPGISSRIAHHLHFPDYKEKDLEFIFPQILKKQGHYFLSDEIQKNKEFDYSYLIKDATYTNLLSLDNLTHHTLRSQADRLYRRLRFHHMPLSAKHIFEIASTDCSLGISSLLLLLLDPENLLLIAKASVLKIEKIRYGDRRGKGKISRAREILPNLNPAEVLIQLEEKYAELV